MFSISVVRRAPFRLLTTPRFANEEKPALALGRSHASWFLVYAAHPPIEPTRAVMCLNFVVPGDPHSVGALSPAGRPMFTVGGFSGGGVMNTLLGLRDQHGVSPISVVKEYCTKSTDMYEPPTELDFEKDPYMLYADVEVLLSENEIMQSCAHCGKWETVHKPRFLRCGGCQSRYYCSEECQKDDWTPQHHEGECGLLRAGKAYEAECRRKLHNNGWWFDYADEGEQQLLADTGLYTYEQALHDLDVDQLAYGRRYPPHDVPPPRRASSHNDHLSFSPGFHPTGDATTDSLINRAYYGHLCGALEDALPPRYAPTPDSVPQEALPKYPPLPETPGFVPSGDPLLDELRLSHHLQKHGTLRQRRKLTKVTNARWKAYDERQRIAAERTAATEKMIEETVAMANAYSVR